MKARGDKKTKVRVVTLGCSKNLVDSEVLMAQLRANKIEVGHEEAAPEANVVVVNTCGFIDNAKEESVNTILEYADIKSAGEIDKLYVTGCLSERYRESLAAEIPEVDAFFGTRELPRLLKQFKADYKHELVGERFLATPIHYAYMKISEGCNRTCSFCAIPLMRGKHISRPIEELVDEARKLAAGGVKELMLIAQELTFYGLDIYKKRRLPELLHALAAVEGIEWIRLHYAYPSQFPLEIIDAMVAEPKICNYLDMPLQHASDPVLKAMRRNISRSKTEDLLDEIRKRNPGMAIRTTMLVGYPGETEKDFEELLEFVENQRFDRLGAFQYSHEEDTRAYGVEDDVPAELKAERAERLMELQAGISFELNQERIGKEMKLLIDRKESGNFIGRTEFDSPEVDNEVWIDAADAPYLRQGDFVQARITDATEFDLKAEVIES